MKIKLKWAYEILRTGSFVIATDSRAAMYLPGLEAKLENVGSVSRLMAQEAAIDSFLEKLKFLKKEHAKAIKKAERRLERASVR